MLIVGVWVLHAATVISTHRPPAHPVPVPIFRPREIAVLAENYDTEILRCNGVSGAFGGNSSLLKQYDVYTIRKSVGKQRNKHSYCCLLFFVFFFRKGPPE